MTTRIISVSVPVADQDAALTLFSFTDPDGNGLVYLQDSAEGESH